MSTVAKLTGAEFDAMVRRGAFEVIGPKKIELIRGELRIMNPAGPIHDDYIDYLTRWSTREASAEVANIRVRSVSTRRRCIIAASQASRTHSLWK